VLAVAFLTLLSCGSSLRRADRFFETGSYAEAAAAYEEALGNGTGRGAAGRGEVDRVLLRLALVYALPESPVHDQARARAFFDQLMERFESGPHRSQAALILDLDLTASSLREELERLRGEMSSCREQLEKLKAIDVDGSLR
jgi:hypothetical protein